MLRVISNLFTVTRVVDRWFLQSLSKCDSIVLSGISLSPGHSFSSGDRVNIQNSLQDSARQWVGVAMIYAFYNLKPIFHCKLGSCWVTNTNEMSTNNMRYAHGQCENFELGTQRNLYSIGSLWGFALGVTQILCFALGVTQILAFLDTNKIVALGV